MRVGMRAYASVRTNRSRCPVLRTRRAQNIDANEGMFEIVSKRAREQRGALDINYQMKPRNLKWRLVNRGFRLVARSGLSKSEFVMGMSHTEGSTALHYAAQQVGRGRQGTQREGRAIAQ